MCRDISCQKELMRLPKLDNRLSCIYDMLGDANSVCDVGADHGKLALRLAKDGRKVIATDISAPSLDKTKSLIALHEAEVDCRVGDGLEVVFPYEVEACVMAGMGQNTIIDIIKRGREVVDACKIIIVQPMNGEYDLRTFLSDEGFRIEDERVEKESGRLYCIIKASPAGAEQLSEVQKHFGPMVLTKLEDKTVMQYVKKNMEVLQGILLGMEQAGETSCDRYKKIKKVTEEMKVML